MNQSTLLNAADKAKNKKWNELSNKFTDHSKSKYANKDLKIINIVDKTGVFDVKVNLTNVTLNGWLGDDKINFSLMVKNYENNQNIDLRFVLMNDKWVLVDRLNKSLYLANKVDARLFIDRVKNLLSNLVTYGDHPFYDIDPRDITKGY